MKKLFTVFSAIFIVVLILCCAESSATPNQVKSAQLVSTSIVTANTSGLLTPTTKSTPTSILTTPVTTPTQELNPYIFAGEPKNVDFSYGPMSIVFTEGALSEVFKPENREIHANLRSPKNLGEFTTTSEALTVGNGIGLARPEQYGNMLLLLHSAYYAEKPLQAEALRFFLERWGKSGTEYVQQKLTEIAGSKGTLTINENSAFVEIVAGVRLEHNEALEMRLHPEQVLDIVAKKDANGYLAIGNPQAFEELKTNGSHALLITFCGWAPNDSEEKYTYYRYVLLLKVNQTSDTIN